MATRSTTKLANSSSIPDAYFSKKHLYKGTMFPVLNLMRRLHKEGKLTPTQAVLMEKRLPNEELYDIKNDPYEIHNLANAEDPAHQETLNQLRKNLEHWITSSNDHDQFPEDPDEIEYWKQVMQERFKNFNRNSNDSE